MGCGSRPQLFLDGIPFVGHREVIPAGELLQHVVLTFALQPGTMEWFWTVKMDNDRIGIRTPVRLPIQFVGKHVPTPAPWPAPARQRTFVKLQIGGLIERDGDKFPQTRAGERDEFRLHPRQRRHVHEHHTGVQIGGRAAQGLGGAGKISAALPAQDELRVGSKHYIAVRVQNVLVANVMLPQQIGDLHPEKCAPAARARVGSFQFGRDFAERRMKATSTTPEVYSR